MMRSGAICTLDHLGIYQQPRRHQGRSVARALVVLNSRCRVPSPVKGMNNSHLLLGTESASGLVPSWYVATCHRKSARR